MGKFSNKDIVLFDFDGVIVDSFSLNLQINKELLGIDWHADEYRRLFLGNVFDAIENHELDALSQQDMSLYEKAYGSQIENLAPIEKIDEMLTLVAASRPAYIVSSSAEVNINRYLKKHNLSQFFNGVFGSETNKSKVIKFNRILDKHQAHTNECVFITDTIGDLHEADEVGIDSVAVTWGFHPNGWFDKSSHHTIVDNIDELMQLF
jgi:phosphoglycolate phosphatase